MMRNLKTKPDRPGQQGDDDVESLLFSWGLRRRRRWSLAFFLLLSLAVHVFAFYLFRPVARGGVSKMTENYQVSILSVEQSELLMQARLAAGMSIPPAPRHLLGQFPAESGIRFEPSIDGYRPRLLQASPTPSLATASIPFVRDTDEPRRSSQRLRVDAGEGEAKAHPSGNRGMLRLAFSEPLTERSPEGSVEAPWSGGNMEGVSCLVGVDQDGHVVSILPSTGDIRKGELPALLAETFRRSRVAPSMNRGVTWGWARLSHPIP